LAMILFVFCQLPFVHDIVCLLSVSLWLWCFLSYVSFPLTMILNVDKRQTISWPKWNWQKIDDIRAKGKLTKDRQFHGQRETDKR
jgi:hypothetical protein